MKNPLEMRPRERLDEITDILTAGVLRLKDKKARKSNHLRDIVLDSSGNQSVHANTPAKRGKTHE